MSSVSLMYVGPRKDPRSVMASAAIKVHKDDSVNTSINNLVASVYPGTPITERAVIALMLQDKGPYKQEDVFRLLNILEDRAKFPLNSKLNSPKAKYENAQLLGLIANDIAKYHPKEPRLKNAILSAIKEIENDTYFVKKGGKPADEFIRFIEALYLVDKKEALQLIDKYRIPLPLNKKRFAA